MNLPCWVLDPYSNVGVVESSNLEEKVLDLITNDELRLDKKHINPWT